jgi:hypothetical protein
MTIADVEGCINTEEDIHCKTTKFVRTGIPALAIAAFAPAGVCSVK